MNLVLDLGNTSGKIAVCDGTRVVEWAGYPKITSREIRYFHSVYKGLKGAIVSSVVNHSREIVDYLNNLFSICIELNSTTALPLLNKYKTPETLGYDRIAAAVGANTLFPGKNVLVIDAGTAITFDIVTKNSEFIGGNISPGMEMRFKALNKFTGRLPYLEAPEDEVPLIGESTHEAIQSGVISGILFEIEGYIHSVIKKYSRLQVVITGGDAKFFEKKLKSSIFVNLNLNIIGLNRILDYNAGKKI
ncbi:MAG: type III pantothenate kinase [Bacteroidales bacterium]|nr:type III pantothenate kinase [Bacteroidales bacterium]MBN2699732.1 type III pantothenate kinase [Bacteroidales bacterium]